MRQNMAAEAEADLGFPATATAGGGGATNPRPAPRESGRGRADSAAGEGRWRGAADRGGGRSGSNWDREGEGGGGGGGAREEEKRTARFFFYFERGGGFDLVLDGWRVNFTFWRRGGVDGDRSMICEGFYRNKKKLEPLLFVSISSKQTKKDKNFPTYTRSLWPCLRDIQRMFIFSWTL